MSERIKADIDKFTQTLTQNIMCEISNIKLCYWVIENIPNKIIKDDYLNVNSIDKESKENE